MTRTREITTLLIVDTFAVAISCLVYLQIQFNERFSLFRFESLLGFETSDGGVIYPLYIMCFLAIFWVVIFVFFGMYRERHASSRFDELVSLAKVVTIGVLLLVFSIFTDTLEAGASAAILFIYWGSVLGLVVLGRVGVRSVQKAAILRGRGTYRALVVGWSDQVERLHQDVARYPAAGLQVVGGIRLGQRDNNKGVDTNGNIHAIEQLPDLIDRLAVRDVLIALSSGDEKELLEVCRLCDGKNVTLKLVPDFYSVIGGMARTEHIYGLPLIEVFGMPMPVWEQSTKRLLDLLVSFVVLVAGLPLWLALVLAVRLTSPGPAIYRQKRVGRKGRHFTMYKFRTMQDNAEKHTGPVWAKEEDPRYTKIGRWLRKMRLDEVPNCGMCCAEI